MLIVCLCENIGDGKKKKNFKDFFQRKQQITYLSSFLMPL